MGETVEGGEEGCDPVCRAIHLRGRRNVKGKGRERRDLQRDGLA